VPKNSLREWLINNNYQDVFEVMENVQTIWDLEGTSTRRNWWEILSGDKKGKPRSIKGFQMPVLRIAQIRQGKQITMDALCRNEYEKLPAHL